MRFVALFIASLLTFSVSAQQLSMNTIAPKAEKTLDYQWNTASAPTASMQVDLKLNPQMITGRNLLIAGGCCLGVGAAIFPLAYLCISDSPGARELGGVCSIGGVTLMGASVPLFIAGSVLYVKGKKNNSNLSFTGNGITVRF